jgi:hypothetical protein
MFDISMKLAVRVRVRLARKIKRCDVGGKGGLGGQKTSSL